MKSLMQTLTRTALAAALGFMGQTPAEAAKKTQVVVTPAPVVYPLGWWWSGQRDPAVAAATTVVGGVATGTYFALRDTGGAAGNPGAAYGITAFGCAVVSPIVATAWANRPLTRREVWTMSASCAVPFVGGWFINAILDANPNPLWDQ